MSNGQNLPKRLVFLLSLFCLTLPSLMAPSSLLAKYKKIEVKINPPSFYPSHWSQEELTIAADPYWEDEKIGQVFDLKDLLKRGILPIHVIIENGSAHPIAVNGRAIQLLDRHYGVFEAMTTEEVLSVLFARSPRRSPPVNLPIPLPKKTGPSAGAHQEIELDLEQNSLHSSRIESGQTRGGFVFFHLPRENTPQSGFRLYIPDIMDVATNKPELFFEIELK
jgi:hypothetical protein